MDGKVGKDLSAKEIELEDERYAEATARILSSDKAFINEYAMNPNLAERFLANLEKVGGWFKRMTSKEARTAYKQVQDIKAKFLGALAERGYQYKNGKVTAAVPDEKEKTAEAVDEGVRFSIKTVKGIGKVAYIDEDLIQRKPGQTYTDAVKEYFDTYLKGMQIPVESSGDTVTVQQKKKFFDKTSFEKNQAVQILDDIIRIGENKVHKENFETDRAGNKKKHSGLSAERGWDYYNTNFEIGDTIYSARVIIRKSGNGVDYFYDLDNIKKSRYTTRRMGTESQTTVRDGVSTDDSISQSSTNVNPESEKSDVRFSRVTPEQDRAYMQAVENGDIRFSRAGVDSYTQKQYNDYGWARANEILTASENSELRSKFADIKKNNHYYPQTKSGDYMIEIGKDGQKIAFMRGTITNPVISSVIEIYANGMELDNERSVIYENERRGIPQTSGDLFRRYNAADFQDSWTGKSSESVGNSGGVKLQRGTSSAETQRAGQNGNKKAIAYHFNDDGSQKITYADGTEEIRFSRAADERFNEQNSDIRFSRAGGNFVDLSDNTELTELIGENKGATKYKIIKQYVLDSLSGEITLSDGIKATIDNRDAQHISHNAGIKKVAELSKIREIVETAKPCAYEGSTDNDKFSSYRYYQAFVRYGKDTFPVYVNVGLTKNNNGYKIYDLTEKIRDTAHLLKGVERLPNGSIALEAVSTDSISQNSDLSRGSDENSDVRFSRGLNARVAANNTGERVYSKKVAKAAIETIMESNLVFGDEYSTLRGTIRGRKGRIIDELFYKLNRTQNRDYQRAVANSIADQIIDSTVLTETYSAFAEQDAANIEQAKRIAEMMSGYRHGIKFKNIEGDVKYAKDDRWAGYKLQWAAEEDDPLAISADQLVDAFDEIGVKLVGEDGLENARGKIRKPDAAETHFPKKKTPTERKNLCGRLDKAKRMCYNIKAFGKRRGF